MSEYTQSTVGANGCDYGELNRVYSQQPDMYGSSGTYTVPQYCPGNGANAPAYPPPYDTLTHQGRFGCGAHFDFSSAYPYSTCTSCNAGFMSRKCDSCDISQGCAKPVEKSQEGFFSRFW